MDRIKMAEVAGLVVAAAGVTIEYLTGVPGFPPIPPGPFILLTAALVVAVVRWRWIPLVGLLTALFVAGGTVLAGTTAVVLSAPDVAGQFLGAVVQVTGLVVAIVAGVMALVPTPGLYRAGRGA
jgi:hypothetical protein